MMLLHLLSQHLYNMLLPLFQRLQRRRQLNTVLHLQWPLLLLSVLVLHLPTLLLRRR